MSVIDESYPKEFAPIEPCFNCGGIASAMWHGEKNLFICSTCAQEVLPSLMVDANHGSWGIYPPMAMERIDRLLLILEKRFWCAATIALLRKRSKEYEDRLRRDTEADPEGR